MFEDTLVESSRKVRMKKGRTVVVSALLHAVLIAVLVLFPLAFTSQIEGARLRSFLIAPPPPPSLQPPSDAAVPTVRHAAASAHSPAVAPSTITPIAPIEVPPNIAYIVDPVPSGPFIDGAPSGPRIGIPGGAEGPANALLHLDVPLPPRPPAPPAAVVTPPPPLPAIRPKSRFASAAGRWQAMRYFIRTRHIHHWRRQRILKEQSYCRRSLPKMGR